MNFEEDEIILSTGKRIYAHSLIVGLSIDPSDAQFHVSYGYDGRIWWPTPEWWDDKEKEEHRKVHPTDAEMKELATYMANAWGKLRDSL